MQNRSQIIETHTCLIMLISWFKLWLLKVIDLLETVQEIPFWYPLFLVFYTWKSYVCFILLYVWFFFWGGDSSMLSACYGNNKNKNLMSTKILFIFQQCSESVIFVFMPASVLVILLCMWNMFLVSWISQVGYFKWHNGVEVCRVSYF